MQRLFRPRRRGTALISAGMKKLMCSLQVFILKKKYNILRYGLAAWRRVDVARYKILPDLNSETFGLRGTHKSLLWSIGDPMVILSIHTAGIRI